MKEFMNQWLEGMITHGSLDACGRKCSIESGMLDDIRKKDIHLKDTSLTGLYEGLSRIFEDHEVLDHKDHLTLTYAFDACVCPIMNEFEIKTPKACECTLGFIRSCISEISSQDWTMSVEDSYIKNGKPCSFKISAPTK